MRRLIDFLPQLNNRSAFRNGDVRRQVRRRRPLARYAGPRQSEQALRREGTDPEGRGRGRFLRNPGSPRQEHRRRLRRMEGHTSASSPTSRWCWRACSTSTSRKAARFVRFCDCFNIPIRHLRRRPGLPARNGAGIRRDHQAWREAAVRLCRGDGPGRSRSSRARPSAAPDVMASKHIARRRELCLAVGADRRDGREGRGRDHLPPGIGDPAKIAEHRRNTRTASSTRSWRAERGYIDEVIQPYVTRWRIARALPCSAHKGLENPGRSTTTFRCEAVVSVSHEMGKGRPPGRPSDVFSPRRSHSRDTFWPGEEGRSARLSASSSSGRSST